MESIFRRKTEPKSFGATLAWGAGLFLTAAVNILIDAGPVAFFSGMLLLTFFPGFLLSRLLIPPEEMDLTSRLLLGVGLSLLLNAVGYLILCYAVERVTRPMVITMILSCGMAFLLLYRPQKGDPRPSRHPHFRWNTAALSLLVIGALFRFIYLGYSDFQGDEAGNCMINSLELIQGNTSVILEPLSTYNRRPPAQVLVPALSSLLTRSFDEGVARFPFALASLVSIWFLYVLGREIFNSPLAGFVSGFLAALNGYFLAYARTVQYQSIMILALVLSLLFLWRFMKTEDGPMGKKNAILAGAFFGFAALAHFEALLFAFPVIYVCIHKGLGKTWKEALYPAALAFPVFMGIVALYYVPLILEPSSGHILNRHWEDRHDASLHFNMDIFLTAIPFYVSRLYLLSLALLAPFAFLRRNRGGLGIVLCWFLPFFVDYVIISRDPQTHVMTFIPAWLLLAGRGFQTISDRLARLPVTRPFTRRLLLFLFPAGLVLVGTFTGMHLYSLWIRHDREYLWSQAATPGHTKTYGFPYNRGWKTAGALFRSGELQGPYHSNEDRKIPMFYLRQVKSPKSDAVFLIKTINSRGWEVSETAYVVGPEYRLRARILSGGKPTILIYQKGGAFTESADHDTRELKRLYHELDKAGFKTGNWK